jgi:hypothetical protein
MSSKSAQLKALGAASNKKMDWATTTVNDPSAPGEQATGAQDIAGPVDVHLRSSDWLKGAELPVKVEIPAGGAAPTAAADPLGEARKAIASGGPKDKVIQRLKEKGIDASGL